MRLLGIVVALVAVARVVASDYDPTAIWWNNWLIESSETTFLNGARSGRPLTYMFDGNPKTAWVFSGTPSKLPPEARSTVRRLWHGDYAISLEPTEAVRVDRLRIMNGYNKSRRIFELNDRVAELQIWEGKPGEDRLVKTVGLSDKMGWHDVSLPPDNYSRIVLVFTKRFSGKVHDLCISGIQLGYRGKPIGPKMPKLVMATDGSQLDGDSPSRLMDANGRKVASDDYLDAEGAGLFAFSPTGRYAAGIAHFGEGERQRLWIYDVAAGRRVVWRKIPRNVTNYEWRGSRELLVEGDARLTVRVP